MRTTNIKNEIKIQNDVCIVTKRLEINSSYTFQNFRGGITDLEDVYEIVKPINQGLLGKWVLKAPGYTCHRKRTAFGSQVRVVLMSGFQVLLPHFSFAILIKSFSNYSMISFTSVLYS